MSEPDPPLDPRLASIAGEDEWQRQRTLDALRTEGLPSPAIRALGQQLADPDATRRTSARMALAALAAPDSASRADAQAELRSALASDAENIRVLAASALGEAGDVEAGPALVGALADPSANVAAAAADALGELRYAPALEALGEVGESGEFWVRAAAVVAMGRLEDERAVPFLDRLSRTPGLGKPIAEALSRIDHPAALPVLERVHETAPDAALRVAGRLLSTHPRLVPPGWVVRAARRNAAGLRRELEETDDPAIARLVGVEGSPRSVSSLVGMAGAPRRSQAAIAGLLAVDPETRADAILERATSADEQELVVFLSLLPPLADRARIRQLVPLLGHESAAVRGAAAEALARADAPQALSLLTTALEGKEVAPEVVRAVGNLGDAACTSLLPLLHDPSAAVRAAAASALTRCATSGLEAELRRALEAEEDPEARDALIRALARSAGAGALDVLDDALESTRADTRITAVEALASTRARAAIPRLERALERSTAERIAGLRSLGELGLPEAAPVVARYLDASDLEERRAAARAAIALADALEPDAVDRLARDEDGWIRTCAARVLAVRGRAGRPLLERMAEADPDPAVRSVARRGLDATG